MREGSLEAMRGIRLEQDTIHNPAFFILHLLLMMDGVCEYCGGHRPLDEKLEPGEAEFVFLRPLPD